MGGRDLGRPRLRQRLLAGSAEHIPLPDSSADVVHARFAANAEQGQADVTDDWWAAHGASRTEVMSRWQSDAWLAAHPDALGLSYGYVLFAVS